MELEGKYKVWRGSPDDEMFADEYETYSPEDAAEKYAEDDVDGNIEGGYQNGMELNVRCPDGTLKRFRVTVEYDPVFSAEEIEDGK